MTAPRKTLELQQDNQGRIGRTVSVFDHGSKTDVDNSAQQITTVDIPALNGVLVKSSLTNASGTYIFVGNSDVTALGTDDDTDGFELGRGESLMVEAKNASDVYVIANSAGPFSITFAIS